METAKMFEPFDMSEIEKHRKRYAEETREKYGNSDTYKESQKKTAEYSKEDWAEITKKSADIYLQIANRMENGIKDPEVQKTVARLRNHITKSFYNCNPDILRGLADLYVSDKRFTAYIDKTKPGLAEFLSKAIIVYCDALKK